MTGYVPATFYHKSEKVKAREIKNQRFGKLIAISRAENNASGRTAWLCQCDCGKIKIVTTKNLVSGVTKSCGCYLHEFKRGNDKYNGGSKDRLYNVWKNMRSRCYDPKCKAYKNYGLKGVTVCEEWNNNENGYFEFKKWALENGFDEKQNGNDCSLDRIDCFGNYAPQNCRWVDRITQQNNMRHNNLVTYCGETHSVKRWSVIRNIPYSTLYYRIVIKGYSPQIAFDME